MLFNLNISGIFLDILLVLQRLLFVFWIATKMCVTFILKSKYLSKSLACVGQHDSDVTNLPQFFMWATQC